VNSQQQQQQPSLLLQEQTTRNSNTERLHSVEAIETITVELQGIFQQLANVVVEQGEKLERIDLNVTETASHVDNAQAELIK